MRDFSISERAVAEIAKAHIRQLPVSVERVEGGLRHVMFRITLRSRAAVVVRFCRSHAAVHREVNTLARVRRYIPVPDILAASTANSREARPFIMLRWIAGMSFREFRNGAGTREVSEAARSIGRVLARLHALAVPTDFERMRWQSRWVLNALSPSQPALTSRQQLALGEYVRRHAHVLRSTRVALCHGDFNNRNIIVAKKQHRWHVAAIIDWENACVGSPISDIATFLQYEHKCDPCREPHFSRAYTASGGELTASWWHAVRTLNIVKNWQTLTHRQTAAEVRTEVAGLLAKYAQEVEEGPPNSA